MYIIFDIFLFLNKYLSFFLVYTGISFPSSIQLPKSSNAFNWFRMDNEKKTLLATSRFALIENNSNHITSLKMLKCFIYRNVRLQRRYCLTFTLRHDEKKGYENFWDQKALKNNQVLFRITSVKAHTRLSVEGYKVVLVV